LPIFLTSSGIRASFVLQLSKVTVVIFSSMFHSTKASYNTLEITSAVCGAGTYMNLYTSENAEIKN
jgi:nucleoside recognition membrane protein YjiH